MDQEKILELELMDPFGLSEIKTEKTVKRFSRELKTRNGLQCQEDQELTWM
jgi:hypothetical protein